MNAPDPDLARRFDAAMMSIYIEAKKKAGYNATYFLQMLDEHGGPGTARKLLQAPEVSSGFMALWERGRLDLTVEALVLQEPWRALFTDEERALAAQRLRDLGYVPQRS